MPALVLPSIQRKDGHINSEKYDERRKLLSTISLEELIDLVSTSEGRASIPFGKFSASIFERITEDTYERFEAALLNGFAPSDLPRYIDAVHRAEARDLDERDFSKGAEATAKLRAVVLKHGNTKQVKKLLTEWYFPLVNFQQVCAWAFDEDFQPRKNFWLLVEKFKGEYLNLAYLALATEKHPTVHQECMTLALEEIFSTPFAKESKANQNHAFRNLLERLVGLNAAKSLTCLLSIRATDKETLEVCLRDAFYLSIVETRETVQIVPPRYKAGQVILDAWKATVLKSSKSKSSNPIETAADELLQETWWKFNEYHQGLSELLAPFCSTSVLDEVAKRMEESISNGDTYMAPHLEVIAEIARKRASGMTRTVQATDFRL